MKYYIDTTCDVSPVGILYKRVCGGRGDVSRKSSDHINENPFGLISFSCFQSFVDFREKLKCLWGSRSNKTPQTECFLWSINVANTKKRIFVGSFIWISYTCSSKLEDGTKKNTLQVTSNSQQSTENVFADKEVNNTETLWAKNDKTTLCVTDRSSKQSNIESIQFLLFYQPTI